MVKTDDSSVGTVVSVNKGGTRPSPAPDHTWFRNNYCWKTDRNVFNTDLNFNAHWSGKGINYRKAGVYCSAGEIYVVLQYNKVRGEGGLRTVEGWLATGWYIASRVTSNLDADLYDFVQNVEPTDRYDYGLNYHF